MDEITLDVSDTEILELSLERSSGSDEVTFSIDGRVAGIEDEQIEEIMRAQRAEPVSLTVKTD